MVETTFASFVKEIFQFLVDTFGVLGLPAAIIVLIIVMVIQAVIAPIISEAILSAAGGVLGEAFGTAGIYAAIIGGIIGSLFGAISAFYIARWIQAQVKQRIVDKYNDVEVVNPSRWERTMEWTAGILSRFIDEDSDDFIEIIEERGFLIVLVGRLLPFVPFDAVSYGSGFTKIQFRDFMIATTIGTIPRVIFYVLLGTKLADALGSNPNFFFMLLFAIVIVIFGLYKLLMYYIRQGGKGDETIEEYRDVLSSDSSS